MIRAVFVDGTSDVVDEKTTRKLRCQCPPERGGLNDTEKGDMNDTEKVNMNDTEEGGNE